MINKLRISNFRLFRNFDIDFENRHSVLIVGRNGTGKSSLKAAIQLLRRTQPLGAPIHMTWPEWDVPVGNELQDLEFEIEITLGEDSFYRYQFEYLVSPRLGIGNVKSERLEFKSDRQLAYETVLDRNEGVYEFTAQQGEVLKSTIDPELFSITSVFLNSEIHPISKFKQFIRSFLILSPKPRDSMYRDLHRQSRILPNGSNIASWYALQSEMYPLFPKNVNAKLQDIWPDFVELQTYQLLPEGTEMKVRFASGSNATIDLLLQHLSDGERCLIMACVVAAWAEFVDNPVCFWDEPDNYLSIDEVKRVLVMLRRSFEGRGQFIATTHHPEAVRAFGRENLVVLRREDHIASPFAVQGRMIDDIEDIGEQLARGDGLY